MQQQTAASGTLLGADNEDHIANSLLADFDADAVKGATLRSGASVKRHKRYKCPAKGNERTNLATGLLIPQP